jgi:hypothetical protein
MQPLNPCELEIDLFCKGIRIEKGTAPAVKLARRTRAGLGSGLELIIPGSFKDIWVNVPVSEPFAHDSPYSLQSRNGEFVLVQEEVDLEYPVRIESEPKWYGMQTSSGRPMSQVGMLQGTYLGVYIGPVCRYWKKDNLENCRFCTTGLNEEADESWRKTVDDVVETCIAARRESGITFVHLNSGYQEGRDLQIAKPFLKEIKANTGLMVGLQLAPVGEMSQYDELIEMGADHFSFCFEFMSDFAFSRYCPGKERTLGQEAFFRAMEYTASKLGKGRVSGEIIAGVEPIEDTLRAIDRITDCGAFPTVCIFRPLEGSAMSYYPSPFYQEMREVFKYMVDQCIAKRIPVGIAPNIEVSLVVQPTDTLYLAHRDLSYYLYQLRNTLLSSVFKPVFSLRLRRGDSKMGRSFAASR